MSTAMILAAAGLKVAAWLVPCVLGALAYVGLRDRA